MKAKHANGSLPFPTEALCFTTITHGQVKDKFVSFKNGQWIMRKHSAGLPECADDSRRVCVCMFSTANV